MVQSSKCIFSKLSFLLTIPSIFVTLSFNILSLISLSLCSQQNPDYISKFYENSDLFIQIDPILELKSPSKVKPRK